MSIAAMTMKKMVVRARTRPGDIIRQIADAAPESGEAMDTIFADFERIIPDGLTHWQHPRFFAYFTAANVGTVLISALLASLRTRPTPSVLGLASSASASRTDGVSRPRSGTTMPRGQKGSKQS